MTGHYCKHCRYFKCEVMGFDGEPMEPVGLCECIHSPRRKTEEDGYCPQFKPSAWALRNEREEAGE